MTTYSKVLALIAEADNLNEALEYIQFYADELDESEQLLLERIAKKEIFAD